MYINNVNGGTNKRTITWGTTGPNSIRVEVTIAQVGTLDRFTVSRTRQVINNWSWGPQHSSEHREFNAQDEAIAYWQDLIRAVLKEHGEPTGQVTMRRPRDITDPQDPKYADANLHVVERKSSKPYRCYTVSDITWARADGKPLTEDDILHLYSRTYGQIHTVQGKAGDMTAKTHTETDSSD